MATSFAALGALVFAGIAIALALRMRRQGRAPDESGRAEVLRWTSLAGAPDDQPLDTATRLDMVERLAVLGEPWCIEALRLAAREERDRDVASAIASALRRR